MVAVVVALLLAGVGWVVLGEDGGDRTRLADAPATTSPSEPGDTEPPVGAQPDEPAPPSTAPGSVSQEVLDAEVDELSRYVESVRGQPFVEPVEVSLLDDAAFEARVTEDFEEDREELAESEAVFKALGVLEPDADFVEVMKDLYGTLVLGFYDPETDELVVRGGALTPYVRQTLLHELVHAWDDQHLGLHRPDYDDADDEIGFGFSAVVEGNANRVQDRWTEDELTAEERRRLADEEAAFAGRIDPTEFPELFLLLVGAPYELGETLVAEIHAAGGERAVSAAIDKPPSTSEQVLEPEAFFDREARVPVEPPEAGGELVSDGVFGMLSWLGLFVTEEVPGAAPAAVGWGGDWYVAWSEGDTDCLRARFTGDAAADNDEFADALAAWAEQAPVRADVTRSGDLVELTTCSLPGAVNPQL